LVLEYPFEARILHPSKGDDSKQRVANDSNTPNNKLYLGNHQNTLQQKINNMDKYRNPNALKNKKFSMTYDNRTHLEIDNFPQTRYEISERFLPILNAKNENTSPNYSQAYQKHHSNSTYDHRNIYSSSVFTRKTSLNPRYQQNDGHNISDNFTMSTKWIKNIPPR
jgi:hypothetical protein